MKAVLTLFLSLFLLSTAPGSAADLGGIIESDTVLTAENSPYTVTGNILIKQNVKLEIEPGVTVKFRGSPISSSGYYIRVDGALKAQGTEEKPILFTAENTNQPWGCIAFTNSSTDWNDKNESGCILSYCIIEYAGAGQDASVISVSASPFITHTTIRNGSSGGIRTSGGFQRIVNNRIHDNGYGIRLSCEGAWIENNRIENNRQQGIYLDSSKYTIEIRNNTIIGSSTETDGNGISIALFYNSDAAADTAASEAVTAAETAIAEAKSAQEALADANPDTYSEAYFAAEAAVKAAKAASDKATELITAAKNKAAELTANIKIHKNHIISTDGNSIAISEQTANANYTLSLTENNIENSKGKLAIFLYNWKHESPEPFDMSGNWWGTDDTDQIGQMIYDSKNDFYLPKVNYQPVSKEKIAEAGSSLISSEDEDSDLPGVISKDTVWTVEGSPYLISGNILIKSGVMLEIQSGVVVKFATAAIQSLGYYIQVEGTLNAQGTESNPVLFTAEDPARTWGCIAFTDTSTDWNESSNTGSILSHCILEYAGNSQASGKKDFGGAAILCFSASPLIKDSIIRHSAGDAIRGFGKDLKILNNMIYENSGLGMLLSSDGAIIENNYLIADGQGIFLDSCTNRIEIRNNTIVNSQPQIYGSCLGAKLYYHANPADIVIQRNIITNKGNGNAIAVTTIDATANDSLSLTENVIDNQGSGLAVYLYNWLPQNPKAIHASENWWGTDNSDTIDRMIVDAENDFYLPKVSYLPLATEAISDAGSDLSYPPRDEETDQPGVISEDTVWTLAESPYIISGNILIKPNASLTVEPGAVIKFKTAPIQSIGYYIRVDGTLTARGTLEKPIRFTAEDSSQLWGCIVFTESSKAYNKTTSGGCVLSRCIIEYAGNSQNGGIKDYGGAAVLCISASPLISDNVIRYIAGDAVRVSGGTQNILSNYIHDNARGIYIASKGGVIADNYLGGNQQGIVVGANENRLDILSNTIESASQEVSGACLSINLYYHLSPSEIRVSKNHLINSGSQGNAVAVSAQSADANDILYLTENTIENRGNLSVRLHDWLPQNPEEIQMSGNWWGSTDTAEIDRMIYDAKNDFYLPEVKYQPFATEKISEAGSRLSPTPTEDTEADQPGVIAEDTVWTLDNSPYMISGNIRILENASLVIEPGVTVMFKASPVASLGYYMQVEGTLKAQGEKDKPVVFTAENPASPWGCIVFTETGTDCILSRCMIEYAGISQEGGLTDYGYASVLCLSASPIISDTIIRKSGGDGIRAVGGNLTLVNNRIYQTARGMNIASADVQIENNYLIYNQQGISLLPAGNRIFLEHNSIITNSAVTSGACLNITLYPDNTFPEIEIYRNHILSQAGNAIGITESQTMVADYELKIRENNIENSGGNLSVYLYNWPKNGQSPRFDMSDNWWGTAVGAEISHKIFDSDNDFYLPEVRYEPFAYQQISGAWSSLLYPPIANAGPDLPVDPNQPIYGDITAPLDGSNSFDPDKKMSYYWTQTGGAKVTLRHADTMKAEFVTPSVTSENAVLTFQLEVKDPEGFYDRDSVSITVTPGGPVKMERDKGQCFIETAGSEVRGQRSGVRACGLCLILYLLIFISKRSRSRNVKGIL